VLPALFIEELSSSRVNLVKVPSLLRRRDCNIGNINIHHMKNYIHLVETFGNLFFIEPETSMEKHATDVFERNFVS
jgi:hypothetical protein